MSTRTAEEAMALNSEPKAPQLEDPTRWVDRYGDALLRFALSRVGRQEVAEDLVQESFLAAWGARKTFDGRSSLGTWLCGILRRKIADYYRRVSRERVLSDVEAGDNGGRLFSDHGKWLESMAQWQESPEQLAENTEFWAVMTDCLANLPAHLAEAFQLREIRFASMDEVCTLTGVTPKNLSVRLHRARLLLRRCLDQKWFRSGARTSAK
jgi:RNA polymerase sigma-70 factor, ECF subfamily